MKKYTFCIETSLHIHLIVNMLHFSLTLSISKYIHEKRVEYKED